MHVVQVVEHHPQSGAWIAAPQPPKGVAQFDHALARAKDPAQAVRMDIVEAEELLGSVAAMIGGAPPARAAVARPGDAAQGAQFERGPTRRSILPPTAGGAGDRAGESLFFLVEVGIGGGLPGTDSLRGETLAPQQSPDPLVADRRQQLAVAAVLGQFGDRPHRKRQPALGAGLDSATSTSSRSCVARTIGGRPLGLATRSKLTNPLRLNRWSQS